MTSRLIKRQSCIHRKEMFYLTTHSTHFIYGYMASDIWLRTILIVRKETRCRHIGYSFRLAARVLLYASSHRQDNTYHGLCYTSRGALAGTRNSSMGSPWRIDPTTHRTMSERSYHGCIHRILTIHVYQASMLRHRYGCKGKTIQPVKQINKMTNGLVHRSNIHYQAKTNSKPNLKAQWVHYQGSIRRPIAPWTDALPSFLHIERKKERQKKKETKKEEEEKGKENIYDVTIKDN